MTTRARSPFRRAAPSASAKPYRIRAAGADEAEILLYDEIGFWGVQAKDFVRDLKAITASTIHLRINSPGGGVFDGMTIFNALKEHPARIVSHVDGLAASIASVIALAGDEVLIAENAFFMIHNAWTLAFGNASELRKTANVLDKVDGAITDTYVRKTGEERDQVAAWMADETWFTAEEALEAGFADRLAAADDAESDADDVAARFDLSVFAKTPEPLLARGIAAGAAPLADPKRDVERLLRDAGHSRSEAKAMVAAAFNAVSPQRDAADGAVLESARRVLALTATTRHGAIP